MQDLESCKARPCLIAHKTSMRKMKPQVLQNSALDSYALSGDPTRKTKINTPNFTLPTAQLTVDSFPKLCEKESSSIKNTLLCTLGRKPSAG